MRQKLIELLQKAPGVRFTKAGVLYFDQHSDGGIGYLLSSNGKIFEVPINLITLSKYL